MKGKKSYHLLSAGWRTKRVYGVIQVESEGMRTWSSDVWEQEKTDISDQEERGTSLVVQWLRLCLPVQVTQFIPWSGKIPHAAGQLSRVPHPLSPHSRACVRQLLSLWDTTEASAFVLLAPWVDWPHWWGQIFLFSLLNQMLISSRNTFIDTLKNNVY